MIEAMGVQLTDLARRLVDEHAFAVLSTINPDGAPQSSVIWVKRDGGDVVFSTIRGRRKTRNMERDPRVSLCMYDPADPYLYFKAYWVPTAWLDVMLDNRVQAITDWQPGSSPWLRDADRAA